MALVNLTGHEDRHLYGCDNPNCMLQFFCYGDGNKYLEYYREHHNPCPLLKVDDTPIVSLDEVISTTTRKRWGTQKWQQQKCQDLLDQGHRVEIFFDSSRSRSERYGYRRL